MTATKTHPDWYEYMEMVSKIRAVDTNAAKYVRYSAEKLASFSRCGVLSECFEWDQSPQGHSFWAAINEAIAIL